MSRRRAAGLAVAAWLTLTAPAVAEMGSESYAVPTALTPKDRAAAGRRIAEDRQREAERQAELARQTEEARRLREAEASSRPHAERLLEERCTGCHGASYYNTKFYGGLSWTAVILRMVYFNGAPLSGTERAILVAHLQTVQPPTIRRRVAEALVAAAGVLALLLPLAAVVWRRRRPGGSERTERRT